MNTERKKLGAKTRIYDIDITFAQMWYWEVFKNSGLENPRQISKAAMPKIFKLEYHKDHQTLNKVLNGKRFPPNRVVSLVNERFHTTDYWLNHPIRFLCHNKKMDPKTIIYHMSQVEDENVFNLVLKKNFYNDRAPTKHNYDEDTLNKLNEISTIDSLTVCFALMREADHFDYIESYYALSKYAFMIFLRVATQYPFNKVAKRFLNVLKESILHPDYGSFYADIHDNLSIDEHIHLGTSLLRLVDELSLLEFHKSPPLTCIYIAQQYFFVNEFKEVLKMRDAGKLKKIKGSRKFKEFTQHLQDWEHSQTSQPTIH